MMEKDFYLGRILTGRVSSGVIRVGDRVHGLRSTDSGVEKIEEGKVCGSLFVAVEMLIIKSMRQCFKSQFNEFWSLCDLMMVVVYNGLSPFLSIHVLYAAYIGAIWNSWFFFFLFVVHNKKRRVQNRVWNVGEESSYSFRVCVHECYSFLYFSL